MSRHGSTGSLPLHQGFTVYQTALGAALQFVPALGTPELDQMIDAYVAGADSIQEKRRTVSTEFFTYAAQTGAMQLFFPVFSQNFGESPASFNDSGYGSGFNVSPVVADMWGTPISMNTPATPSTPASAFVAPSQGRVAKPKASSSRKASTASSRASAPTYDFSNLPGMKILTKDGVDVTNSASRGCKTKQAREHAHLIRLLKACDSCKRKKVRCDPSHKRGSSSQPQSAAKSAAPKKSKKVTPPPATPQFDLHTQDVSDHVASDQLSPFEDGFEMPLDSFDWNQFLNLEEDSFTIPMDYDFSLDPQGLLTPSSGSSASPSQSSTPAFAGLPAFDAPAVSAGFDGLAQQPQLPYLNPDGHGIDYVDFTLYSPASSFIDEEPKQLQSAEPSPIANAPVHEQYYDPGVAGRDRLDSPQHRHRHDVAAADATRVAFQGGLLSWALDRDQSDPGYSDLQSQRGGRLRSSLPSHIDKGESSSAIHAQTGASSATAASDVVSTTVAVATNNNSSRVAGSSYAQEPWTAPLSSEQVSTRQHVMATQSPGKQSLFSSAGTGATVSSSSTQNASLGMAVAGGLLKSQVRDDQESSHATPRTTAGGTSTTSSVHRHAQGRLQQSLSDIVLSIQATSGDLVASSSSPATIANSVSRGAMSRKISSIGATSISSQTSQPAGETRPSSTVSTDNYCRGGYEQPDHGVKGRTNVSVSAGFLASVELQRTLLPSQQHLSSSRTQQDVPQHAPHGSGVEQTAETFSSAIYNSPSPSVAAQAALALCTAPLISPIRHAQKSNALTLPSLLALLAVLGIVSALAVSSTTSLGTSPLWGLIGSSLPMLALSLASTTLRYNQASHRPLQKPSINDRMNWSQVDGIAPQTSRHPTDRLRELQSAASRHMSRRVGRWAVLMPS